MQLRMGGGGNVKTEEDGGVRTPGGFFLVAGMMMVRGAGGGRRGGRLGCPGNLWLSLKDTTAMAFIGNAGNERLPLSAEEGARIW